MYYHNLLLRRVPTAAGCRALDVGCGTGLFAARLAERATHVDAIDVDADAVVRASNAYATANLSFITGDFMQLDLADESYDFISSIASLHHMDVNAALPKMKSLLRPNGVLVILGLYRDATFTDYLLGAASFPISKTIRALTRRDQPLNGAMRLCEPTLPFTEIK